MIEPSLPMRVCAAAAFNVAYAASAGTLLNRLWLGGSNTPARERKLRHWLAVCSLLMLFAIPLQVLLLAASMTGDLSWRLAWSALPDVVTTHSGHRLLTLFHDDNLPLPRLAFERIWFLHYLRGPERMAQTCAVLGTLMAELGACTSA